MLLEGYEFSLQNIFCMPNSMEFNTVALLQNDISGALPYLNSVIPNCTYVHEARILDFMKDGHIITLEPTRIKVTGLAGEREAGEFLEWLKGVINDTWERRSTLRPSFERIRPVTLLDLYRRLPGGNCGECGEPTCMAFAAGVSRRTRELDECPRLATDAPNRPSPFGGVSPASGLPNDR